MISAQAAEFSAQAAEPPEAQSAATTRGQADGALGTQAARSARARLIHDVRVALRRSGYAEVRGVEIDVQDQCVVILGRVPTFFLKQLCQEVVRVTAPGHAIRNVLTVASRL